MSVAPLLDESSSSPANTPAVEKVEGEAEAEHSMEALMILGVKGEVGKEVERELREDKGILDVSVVKL